MNNGISLQSAVAASHQQVSCDLEGETVILSMNDGVYYGLDPVGTSVWNLLQEPRTVSGIRDQLLQEYDVEAERCERDLLSLLERMVARGLVEVRDAAAA